MSNHIKLDEQEIKRLYIEENLSTVKIAKKFNVSYSPIVRILKKNKVKIKKPSLRNRKYEINENFFDNIDTHEKSYILGLIYADGCNKTYKKQVEISLHEKDKDILEKISKLIQPEKPLYHKRNYNQFSFRIENKHISEQLEKLGVIKAKTHKLKFPNRNLVPKEFVNSFLLGYFDGDGGLYISKGKNKRSIINITGTENFINKIIKISKKLECNWYKRQRFPERKNNIFSISMCGSNQCLKFLNWIYKDSSIYMNRKNKAFQQLIKIQREKSIKKKRNRELIKKRKIEKIKNRIKKRYKKLEEINSNKFTILKLYNEGKSIRDINKIIPLDRRTISKILKINNVKIKKGGWKTKGHNQYTHSKNIK